MVAAFVAGSFIASPELRAFAANTVFSADIVDGEVKTADLGTNAVTAAKVKDGEIKAAEIATDAVGAAELQGVTKLMFAHCVPTNAVATTSVDQTKSNTIVCNIAGVDEDDDVIATFNKNGNACFAVSGTFISAGTVKVVIRNTCGGSSVPGVDSFVSLIVYDK